MRQYRYVGEVEKRQFSYYAKLISQEQEMAKSQTRNTMDIALPQVRSNRVIFFRSAPFPATPLLNHQCYH